jgi:hypothetical protein
MSRLEVQNIYSQIGLVFVYRITFNTVSSTALLISLSYVGGYGMLESNPGLLQPLHFRSNGRRPSVQVCGDGG